MQNWGTSLSLCGLFPCMDPDSTSPGCWDIQPHSDGGWEAQAVCLPTLLLPYISLHTSEPHVIQTCHYQ